MRNKLQYRLSALFTGMTLCAISLGLNRIDFKWAAAICTVVLIAAALLRVIDRCIAWGYVAGVVCVVAVALAVAYVRSERPFAEMRGAPEPSLLLAREYAFSIGGPLGIGIAYAACSLFRHRDGRFRHYE